MNIKLCYLYRDSGNYKNHYFEVFTNKLALSFQEMRQVIKSCLIDETWFYASNWGLKDLHYSIWDDEIDHTFHEFDGVTETNEPATREDIYEFLQLIKSKNKIHGR